MRTAGAVYKKLKEVRYRHLVDVYKKHFRRLPLNCKYNHTYQFVDGDGNKRELQLCLFNQENTKLGEGVKPQLLDVCEAPRHFQQCNAFIFKYSKEDIKALFEKELLDKELKARKYPDVCALEWVLEKYEYESGFIKKIISKFKNWGQHEKFNKI